MLYSLLIEKEVELQKKVRNTNYNKTVTDIIDIGFGNSQKYKKKKLMYTLFFVYLYIIRLIRSRLRVYESLFSVSQETIF